MSSKPTLKERIAKIVYCFTNCRCTPKNCWKSKCDSMPYFRDDLKKPQGWINVLTNSFLADPEIKEALELLELKRQGKLAELSGNVNNFLETNIKRL